MSLIWWVHKYQNEKCVIKNFKKEKINEMKNSFKNF